MYRTDFFELKPVKFTGLILILLLTISCAGGEEVIVDDEPSRPSENREQDAPPEDEDAQSMEFQSLKIGYADSVNNLDPLFASSSADLRTVSMIYEGLFSLNSNAEPEPALVNSYEISNDSLRYTFYIGREVFFQDNEVFSAGVGRRMVATDVTHSFQRTAHLNVPPLASGLFENIEGYELYFAEQRNVFDPSQRILPGISGIRTPNDTTIVISLEKPDPDFLYKLSSPYAVIYPPEATRGTNTSLKKNPVGTGLYSLNRITKNGDLILTRNEKYRGKQSTREFNRIDIKSYDTEGKLFQEFAKGEVDIIPDPGPDILRQILDTDGEISPAYRSLYNVVRNSGQRKGYFALNPGFNKSFDPLGSRIAQSEFEFDQIDIYGIEFSTRGTVTAGSDVNGELEETYLAPFSTNLYIRKILIELSNNLLEPVSQFQMMDIRAPNPFIALLTQEMDRFHYDRLIERPEMLWFEYTLDNMMITHRYVNGLSSNGITWWLNTRPIRVNRGQRAGS